MKSKKKTILVAPLSWGLGHASRSVPIIQALLKADSEVIIASDSEALSFLKQQFPSLSFLELPGYKPSYPTEKGSMVFGMALQLPHFLSVIKRENEIIEKFASQCHIDYILSDNRYGVYHNKIPSIFITHQLNVLMPKGFRWMQKVLKQRIIEHISTHFKECWVPDEKSRWITREMTDVKLKSQFFIGWLSHVEKGKANRKWAVSVILSGPEPQRTILENKLIDELKTVEGNVRFIRGSEKENLNLRNLRKSVEVISIANSLQIAETLIASEVIVSRSGYSSVMDYIKLKLKRVILIPTPQQTEQIYLAEFLMNKRICLTVPQNELHLYDAIKRTNEFNGFGDFNWNGNLLSSHINRILKTC